ncbi:MAG: hypothetical protein ACJ77A_17465 [Actinomycetota bacterium]
MRLIGGVSVCAAFLAATSLAGDARATDGDPVLLGMGNNASSGTSINTTSGIGLSVATTDTVSTASGLRGAGPIGVVGESGTGIGVSGTTSDNTGSGVFGENNAATNSGGSGVVGIAAHNIGVSAISSNGTALAVTGVAIFTRSGRATVPAGINKVTVSNIKLSKGSMILATVQQAGRPAVKAAVPNVATNRFTIYLAKAPTKPVRVAWFVLS